ncbi:hypothetical protein [Serratia marcescens]|uniref:hypothetical protein n=1 Tax=Serratia marcescens TaxID=615 RepID=UPI0013DD365A|nr:hypothetical protein [Serratia marcescens]
MDNNTQIIHHLRALNSLLDSTPKSLGAGDTNKIVRELSDEFIEKLRKKFPYTPYDFQFGLI